MEGNNRFYFGLYIILYFVSQKNIFFILYYKMGGGRHKRQNEMRKNKFYLTKIPKLAKSLIPQWLSDSFQNTRTLIFMIKYVYKLLTI